MASGRAWLRTDNASQFQPRKEPFGRLNSLGLTVTEAVSGSGLNGAAVVKHPLFRLLASRESIPSPAISVNEAYYLIRFAGLVLANLNRNFPIEPLEKIEQLVGSEAVEMSVQQVDTSAASGSGQK